MPRIQALALAFLATLSMLACRSKLDEPRSRERATPLATTSESNLGGDPMNGTFTLQQATAGLGGEGKLIATIETKIGSLECELFEDKAPIAVANFVGLARGKRPFKGPGGAWVSKPAYDGTVFHRVKKGFMIQGGDWKKNGTGDAGYTFVDEIWPGATHDRRGQLCFANKGPNTNSMQFFITDGPAKHLDGGFTIFGHCGPDQLIEELASVPTTPRDLAIQPTVIKKVSITRRKAEPADASAGG
jgi:peptidyl-prolyl cis-trans isomerase A (cyclophilin A)